MLFIRILFFLILSFLGLSFAQAESSSEIDPSFRLMDHDLVEGREISKAQFSFEVARTLIENSIDKILLPMLEKEYNSYFLSDAKMTYQVSQGIGEQRGRSGDAYYQYDFFSTKVDSHNVIDYTKVLSLRLYYNRFSVSDIEISIPQRAKVYSNLQIERSIRSSLYYITDKHLPSESSFLNLKKYSSNVEKNPLKYEQAKILYEDAITRMQVKLTNSYYDTDLNIFLPEEVAEKSLEEAQLKIQKEIDALKVPYTMDLFAEKLSWRVKFVAALGVYFDVVFGAYSLAIGYFDGVIGSTLTGLILASSWATLSDIRKLYNIKDKGRIRQFKLKRLELLQKNLPKFYRMKEDLERELYLSQRCRVSAAN
ncbi:MAG: hypothetical protein VX642_16430 [Bdellovibrionota bacterium]|nr:hypothetical protein [Bdellovibrionota bacterium]